MVQRRDGEMGRNFKDIEVSEEECYDEAVRVGRSALCRDGFERWRERLGYVLWWQSEM